MAADDAKAILNRVRQIVRALRTFDKQAQSRFGLGAAQMFIVHILQNDDGLSLNELANHTATDQSSVSLAVGKLVSDGYVKRAESEVDRRQVHLSLTAKGRALARRSPPAAQERILESVQAMKRSERTQLTALLDQLIGGLSPLPDGPPAMLFQDEEEARPRRRTASTYKRKPR
jgi:DNA-binding MarR family transcriptional regulator